MKTKTHTPTVRIRVPLNQQQLKAYMGPKCEVFERHCPCCESWKDWEKTGKITIVVTVSELIKDY